MNFLKKLKYNIFKIRWMLVLYDIVAFLFVNLVYLGFLLRKSVVPLYTVTWVQVAMMFACLLTCRMAGKIYRQIWRYGGIQCYLRLLLTDMAALGIYSAVVLLVPQFRLSRQDSAMILMTNMALTMTLRMVYRYAYKYGNHETKTGRFLMLMLQVFAGMTDNEKDTAHTIKIAIIGVSRMGVSLAEELLGSKNSAYTPRCFVDVENDKPGREIHGLPVLSKEEATFGRLIEYDVQEVVVAIPTLDNELKKQLYEKFQQLGYKVKVYDYPTMEAAGGKRQLREFDVEELLFRRPIVVSDERTNEYYMDKVVLITGGGGSIGSELCRQLAKMSPRQIIILDIYENGVYNVQQELKILYRDALDLCIEIASITNEKAMRKVFERYRPQIVINAAAHKHVPLMEHNCVEAVENNVFGTKVVIDLCEEYGVERFLMVSTDKAVNPTNVMGATKRMCEMLVQSQSTHGNVNYSCTRFGNVLGSAGSVIPLFKRQIASGGPVTITDKRIIRYFMTIPEASQLVLQCGAMAKNGELFVLDMGKPTKILDLAENMIKLSGAKDIEIVETGLRPGEKLYEELLVKTEELDKTDNRLIFIERDTPLNADLMDRKMAVLRQACATGEDAAVKAALRQVVSTYRSPEEVNRSVPAVLTGEGMGIYETTQVHIETEPDADLKTQPRQAAYAQQSSQRGESDYAAVN